MSVEITLQIVKIQRPYAIVGACRIAQALFADGQRKGMIANKGESNYNSLSTGREWLHYICIKS
jgi:hypothetical protein